MASTTQSAFSCQFCTSTNNDGAFGALAATHDGNNATLHAQTSAKVASHYKLIPETREWVVHKVVEYAVEKGHGEAIDIQFIDGVMVNVFRHDVIKSNKIKDFLALELGVNRLDGILSPEELGDIHKYLNLIARIIIKRLCRHSTCKRH